jgi:hypothetical protein
MRTQQEKVLAIMQSDPAKWWLPHEIMSAGAATNNFVGYEASARMSELGKMGKLESKRSGKYMARRLKTERHSAETIVSSTTSATATSATSGTAQTALLEVAAPKPKMQWYI